MKRFNRREGFTLTELLTVLAITIVLFGLATVYAVRAVGNYRQTERDETAKAIFIAAENSLANMTASGRAIAAEGLGDALSGVTGVKYVGDADALMASLLPAGSDLTAGCRYIELDPKSGHVYGVFYAEEPFTYTDQTITQDLRDNKADRMKLKIGYYGAEDTPDDTLGEWEYNEVTGGSFESSKQLFVEVYDDYGKVGETHAYMETNNDSGVYFSPERMTPGGTLHFQITLVSGQKLTATENKAYITLHAYTVGSTGEPMELSYTVTDATDSNKTVNVTNNTAQLLRWQVVNSGEFDPVETSYTQVYEVTATLGTDYKNSGGTGYFLVEAG